MSQPTISLYTSVPASAEVLRAAHHLSATSGRPVQVRSLSELPPPPTGRSRRRCPEEEPPGAEPAGQ